MDLPYQLALAKDPWVQALPPSTREAFIAAIRPKPYSEGAEIFAQGDAAVAYYGILSGEARFTKVTADGRQKVRKIDIDPEAIDPEDLDELADLVTAAVNMAIQASLSYSRAEMKKITGGLVLPGMM